MWLNVGHAANCVRNSVRSFSVGGGGNQPLSTHSAVSIYTPLKESVDARYALDETADEGAGTGFLSIRTHGCFRDVGR